MHYQKLGGDNIVKEKFKKPQSSSIKFKLTVAYASIVTLTILIFSLTVIWRSETVVFHLAQQNVEQAISASHQALNSKIDNINASILSFQTKKAVQDILTNGSHDTVLQQIDTLERALMEVDMFQSNISKLELFVLNRDDYPPPSSGGSVFSAGQMENDIWFKGALQQGNSTGWTIRNNNIDDTNSFIIVSKLITDVTTNQPLAVLKASISKRNFVKSISDVTLAETGKLFLASKTHLVDYNSSTLGSQLVNDKVLFTEMLKSDSIETRSLTLGREKCLVSSYPIKNTGMFLVGAVRIKEFRSTQNAITVAIFIVAFVILLLSLIFIWFVLLTITRPISALTSAMRSYTPGSTTKLKSTANDEIGILFSVFNNTQITINDLIDNIELEATKRKRAELKALQAQITPHFLYNTLNSICALAKKYNANDIQQMIVALSKFFAVSLSNGAELITLEQELEHVNSYVYIQKIRYADKFTLHTDIPEDLMQKPYAS